MVNGFLVEVLVKKYKFYIRFPYLSEKVIDYNDYTIESSMSNATVFENKELAHKAAHYVRNCYKKTIIPYQKEIDEQNSN